MGVFGGFAYARQVMIRKLAVWLLISAPVWAADVNIPTVAGISEFTEAYQAWDENGFMKAAATFAQAPDSFANQYWRGAADFHRLLFLLGEPATAKNRRLSAQVLDATITTSPPMSP